MGNFRRRAVYEGPEKIFYEGPEPGTLVQHFKDFCSHSPMEESVIINGRGILNNRISELLLQQLNNIGLPTHFIRGLNMREQLVRALDIIPIVVRVRNIIDEAFSQKYAVPVGTRLPRPLVEFTAKKSSAERSILSTDHLTALAWVTEEEIDTIQGISLRTNDFLTGYFSALGLILVDFHLEFGRLYNYAIDESQIILGDGITPDSCQLWDAETSENFSQISDEEGYFEIAERLGVLEPEWRSQKG